MAKKPCDVNVMRKTDLKNSVMPVFIIKTMAQKSGLKSFSIHLLFNTMKFTFQCLKLTTKLSFP